MKSVTESKFYSIILTKEQVKFLTASPKLDRMKCLLAMFDLVALMPTEYSKETGFRTTLNVGQFAMTESELANMWGCSRNAASNLIDGLNQMKLIRSEQGRRTSVHTVLCVAAWVVDNVVISNPNWHRPADWNFQKTR